MPSPGNYQNEIERLNKEISDLKDQILVQQMQSENYKASLARAQKNATGMPKPSEINPILKQIRNKKMSLQEKSQIAFPDLYPSSPEDVYYQWIAPSRVVVKRDRQWYWTAALVIAIIVVFAVLVNQLICVAVALSFFFAIYVNSSVPAADVVYKLTKQGLEIGEGESIEIYAWGQLLEYSYYFKNNTEALYIDTILAVPQRIQVLFSQEDRKNINLVLENNLPYKPAPKKQGFFSRWTEGTYIPKEDFLALQQKIDQYYDQKYAEIIASLKREGKVPQNVTVEEIRNAENLSTLKLLDDLQKQQEEEAKKLLGLN